MTEYSIEQENGIPYLREDAIHQSICVHSAKDIYGIATRTLRLDKKAEEYVYLLGMNATGKVNAVFQISKGSATVSYFNASDMFVRLLLSGAVSFAVIHNHPSGKSEPSGPDIDVTKKIKELAKLSGHRFLDHVIVGENEYYSFQEHSMI